MRVRRLGQSAFTLTAGSTSVVIDPFDDAGEVLAARGLRFAYPLELGERWTVPVHHRTGWVDFLEPVDAFVDAFAQDERLLLDGASFETGDLPSRDGPLAVVPSL